MYHRVRTDEGSSRNQLYGKLVKYWAAKTNSPSSPPQDVPINPSVVISVNDAQFAHECCGDQLKVPDFGQVIVATSNRWLVSLRVGQRVQTEANYLCRSRRSSQ